MTTDILGNELAKGDTIIYTTKQVKLHKGIVLEVNTKRPSRYSRPDRISYNYACIRVKGDNNTLPGWTYANRCCKLNIT